MKKYEKDWKREKFKKGMSTVLGRGNFIPTLQQFFYVLCIIINQKIFICKKCCCSIGMNFFILVD